jgi:broad specificity phosphatase PhoE
LNKGGTEERLRGWLPVPLTPQGVQQAHDVAGQLSLRPDSFSASDLPRAAQTADIVGKHLGMAPKLEPNIRDWNTGDLAGTKVTDSLPQMKELIRTPDVSAPNGESIDSYLARFVPEMRKRIEDPGMHLVVGHARGAMVLQGIASPVNGKGEGIDPKYLLDRPDVDPGGVMTIDPRWNVKVQNPKAGKAGKTS